MAQPTLSETRVVDPVLTEVARGYASPKASAADALFPIVSVAKQAGKIIKFGPEAFQIRKTARAPGANTKRVQIGYSSENYSLVEHRLEALVPREMIRESRGVPGIDVVAMNISVVQDSMALEREKQAADLARTVGNYHGSNHTSLSNNNRWDIYNHVDSTPFADILAGKNRVRSQTGEKANTIVMGSNVLTALRSHPKVLERLSTATDRPPATLVQLAALFEVDNVVEAPAIYWNGTAMVDVWGNDLVIAYTTPRSAAQMGSPSYGYTYQLEGHPYVEEGYYDNNTASWMYPVSDAYQPVIASNVAGYLIQTAVGNG